MADLKALAAETWGISPDEVTDDHVKFLEGLGEKVKPTAVAPAVAPPDLGAKKLAELEEKLKTVEEEKNAEILDLQRKMAEKGRPPMSDPEEEEKVDKVSKRIRSLPELQEAVTGEEENEEDVQTFRKHWDMLHFIGAIKGNLLGDREVRQPAMRTAYWQRLEARYPRMTDAIKTAVKSSHEKANSLVDTQTTGEGAEWSPSLYSSDLIELVMDRTGVADLFPRMTSPRDSWVLPYSPGAATVYRAGEALTTDAAEYTPSPVASGSKTVTAKKLICRVPWSDEFDENSIIAAASLFQAETVRAMAAAIDSAVVNGDTTATHQDTGKSYNSTSPETAWDGLRDIIMNTMTSATTDFNAAGPTGDALLALQNKCDSEFLDKDPADWALLAPVKLRHKFYSMIDNATNKNGVWQHNTPMQDELVRNGAIMPFYGIGVYTNAAVWSDTNASGIYDGTTTTNSVVIFVYRPAFLVTDRRMLSSIMYNNPLNGTRNVITSWRGSFDAMQAAATHVFGALGYEILTA